MRRILIVEKANKLQKPFSEVHSTTTMMLRPLLRRTIQTPKLLHRAAIASLPAVGSSSSDDSSRYSLYGAIAAAVAAPCIISWSQTTSRCEESPSFDQDELPVFRASEVACNNGSNGRPVWVTYGGMVYDITSFIKNHPGGSEKIMEAAGKSVEPHWFTYRQHFASDLPMKFLENMAVGRLHDADQEVVDAEMEKLEEADPYAREPKRHAALIVHSETPMNAEVPEHLLTRSFLTPNHLFYIRHHHPVPFLTPTEINDYKVTIDLTSYNGTKMDVSLKDIKNLPKIERVVTLQCSGNRRGHFNAKERTSGTPWGTWVHSVPCYAGRC